jgi:predicted AAA+ superfamily ATPase
MKRELCPFIEGDLKKKIVLISGPRQTGKTTLSKQLTQSYEYLNYDLEEHRGRIENKEWDRNKNIVILDEIHKMNRWKAWLKGIYDVEGLPPGILVTGSAKLDTYRKVGDSLAGRYYLYRLHPFDLKELKKFSPDFDLESYFKKILEVGGFPEPFLDGTLENYRRWRRTHLDIILRQDLISLENVSSIIGIENLIRLLRTRVGGTISHNNLANDLGVDPKTVKSWIEVLERMFVIFKVAPFSKKIKDSLLKAPKYYFYDNGLVEGDQGVKLENLVACALFKELNFIQDTQGTDVELNFLRTKKGEEVDFLVSVNNRPTLMIEVKWSEDKFSKSFAYFERFIKAVKKIQLVGNLTAEKTLADGSEMRSAASWLSDFKLD